MSRMKRMIDLRPDPSGGLRETLVSVGHRCERCKGSGFYWSVDAAGNSTKMPCKVCGGKRELDAVISITWKPTCKE